MKPDEFLQALQRLSAQDIDRLAAGIRVERDTDGDLAWWQATLALDRSVRRQHRSISAATAAATAARAVVVAAGHAGLPAEAASVVDVARAAADVARTLVAEDARADPCYFFHGWERVMNVPAWAPCDIAGAAA
jgi:hypothetical protein